MSGGGSQKVSRVLDDIRDEPRTVAPCPVEKHRVFGSGVLARWLPVYPKADIQAGKKLSPARKLVFFFFVGDAVGSHLCPPAKSDESS